MFTVFGAQSRARMSSTEWIGASQVTRSSCPFSVSRSSGVRRGSSISAWGKAAMTRAVRLRGRGVAERDVVAVLALHVNDVHHAERGELGDELLRPVVGGVELEAQGRLVAEHPHHAAGAVAVVEPRRDDEGDGRERHAPGRRRATHPPGAARGRARRSRRPSGGSRGTAPSRARPPYQRSSPSRWCESSSMLQPPVEGERRAGLRLPFVVLRHVGDVLADALLAAAVEVDHGGRADELGRQLERSGPRARSPRSRTGRPAIRS